MSKMNYELAKKLQNAGFPQKGTVFVSNTEQIHTKEQLSVVDEGVYYPTLEELIEACGPRFFSLKNLGVGWQACVDSEQFCSGEAKTAVEAVANLWLALQGSSQMKV